MVEYVENYKLLLQRGAGIYEELLLLYAPEKKSGEEWAIKSALQTSNQRISLLERLADPLPRITAEETSALVASIGHYLDRHWADYQEFPVNDQAKRSRLVELHAKLETVIKGFGQIYNALRAS